MARSVARTLPAPAGTALAELFDRLSDFWFGMSLLGVWGVMTLIGVVVDQGKDADFYARN